MADRTDELQQLCEEIVPRFLRARQMRLITEEELAGFIEEVREEAQVRLAKSRRRPLDKIIEDATINRYNHWWWAWCGGSNREKQEQALNELYVYLYRVLLSTYPGLPSSLAEELTQQALINVWEKLSTIHDPGTFARWSSRFVVWRVPREWQREVRQTVVVDEGDPDSLDNTLTEGEGAAQGPSAALSLSEAAQTAQRQRISAAIQRCLKNDIHRRLILGLFLEEKGLKEMAELLNRRPTSLSVAKWQALQKLRQCDEVLKQLEDFVDGMEGAG